MAFNFNWSPLTADAEFYTRAQDMLTAALNKSPKPPIIVDDIIVNELNLGSVPPELEILEIGDLAEDRFRGIFKMCYSGDAFLTLKTRVQANPLNTYLFSKPSFCSPQPLAASSGLTIPLQITLSEIKLSAFIILVFSKQKGLTLVFRNDPLESLKVSSTFDSIPFVREYLQKEIEGQLRNLFMEDLPAIIHRLSLRLWCPDSGAREEDGQKAKQDIKDDTTELDPFASPPQDAVDAHGNVIDAQEISNLSLEGGSETHLLFSQKNLLRLAALTDSQRTLSLFTPSIREAVFRAWASPTDRSDSSGSSGMTPSLSRTASMLGSNGNSGTTYTFSDNGAEAGQLPSRPSLTSLPSMTGGLSLGSGRHSRTNRKKKTRVVNLRRNRSSDNINDTASESGESTTETESSFASSSEPIAIPSRIPEEPEEELVTPPRSPNNRVRFRSRQDSIDLGETITPVARRARAETLTPAKSAISQRTSANLAKAMDLPTPTIEDEPTPRSHPESSRIQRPTYERSAISYPAEKGSSSTYIPFRLASPAPSIEAQGHGIIEQAWMMKMASELARRAHEQKASDGGFWQREETPPPAYEIQ